MKKVVSLVTIFVLCLTALAGCSGSKEVDLKTVLSDINSKYSLDLKELTDSNDLKNITASTQKMLSSLRQKSIQTAIQELKSYLLRLLMLMLHQE